MRKIPTLFVRDYSHGRPVLTDRVTSGCEWVIAGEGVSLRKYDGTCVLLTGESDWTVRREVKAGKTPPPGWIQVDVDPVTGNRVGWEPADQSGFRRFMVDAILTDVSRPPWLPGTYELIGPKINGNPERATEHRLIRHVDAEVLAVDVRSFKTLEVDLTALMRDGIEGVVWHHHSDGRMAKLKGKDFA